MKKTKVTVLLNQKEAYLLWAIMCWFYKPVTSSLKYKLHNIANQFGVSGGKGYQKMSKKYDNSIIKRIKLG